MRRAFGALLAGCLTASLLWATQPRIWTVSTFDQFLSGRGEGIAMNSSGRLVVAPALETILDTREAFVYSAVLDRSGNLFAGTGSNGKIFRFPATGGPASEWTTLEEPGVFALAVDSLNRVYAATAPDGKVYRISPQGQAEVFFRPDDKFIWSLEIDDQNNVYVGTGPRGVIHRVAQSGQSSVFYDSSETHIVRLGWDINRNLLAGTAPGGRLYRVSAAGSAFVLHDSPLQEMKAITVDRYGNVFAAALSAGESGEGGSSARTASPSASGAASTEESVVQTVPRAQGARLEVYRIDKDNLVETLYASSDEVVFDLLVRDDGNLLLATGDKGRILAISPQRFLTVLVETGEDHVTRLLERESSLLAVTSNLGKILRVQSRPSAQAFFESHALDAGMTADWGKARWRVLNPAGDPVRIFTRSGNTRKPGETWSEWHGPLTDPSGSRVESPPARYLQWKVEFPAQGSGALISQSNEIDSVSISYMQRNAAPEIARLTVHAPGVAFLKLPPANPAGGVAPGGPDGSHSLTLPKQIREIESPRVTPPARPVYIPGARSFSWAASDPNDDDLIFTLQYRRVGETRWNVLDEDLTENNYTMDGASFPDGEYQIRLTASDHRSNPPGKSLRAEMVSSAFTVSNTAPAIRFGTPRIQGQNATLPLEVNASGSLVYQAEFSVDSGPWVVLFPEDGIADSSNESYRIQLDSLRPGSYSIRVRASDSVG
ncbi:MAG TPA: hypothetical protein VMN76_04465, partial [Acidobacteriota bacterium]|nr:hypothetical protein [Acidobacteriota bacterium]